MYYSLSWSVNNLAKGKSSRGYRGDVERRRRRAIWNVLYAQYRQFTTLWKGHDYLSLVLFFFYCFSASSIKTFFHPLEKPKALYLYEIFFSKFYLVLLHLNHKRRYKYFVMTLLQEFHWDMLNESGIEKEILCDISHTLIEKKKIYPIKYIPHLFCWLYLCY